jgi:hypothetical protein
VILEGEGVVESAVEVMDDGDSVTMGSGDSPMVDGIASSVDLLGDANVIVIDTDGSGTVVGVNDDTDDVPG